jgi:hypothetical protein
MRVETPLGASGHEQRPLRLRPGAALRGAARGRTPEPRRYERPALRAHSARARRRRPRRLAAADTTGLAAYEAIQSEGRPITRVEIEPKNIFDPIQPGRMSSLLGS